MSRHAIRLSIFTFAIILLLFAYMGCVSTLEISTFDLRMKRSTFWKVPLTQIEVFRFGSFEYDSLISGSIRKVRNDRVAADEVWLPVYHFEDRKTYDCSATVIYHLICDDSRASVICRWNAENSHAGELWQNATSSSKDGDLSNMYFAIQSIINHDSRSIKRILDDTT